MVRGFESDDSGEANVQPFESLWACNFMDEMPTIKIVRPLHTRKTGTSDVPVDIDERETVLLDISITRPIRYEKASQ